MKIKSKYENPSFDDVVAWLYDKENNKNKYYSLTPHIKKIIKIKIEQYTEKLRNNPEVYEKDLADAIRGNDTYKLFFFLDYLHWHKIFHPSDIIGLFEDFDDSLHSSFMNSCRVVSIIQNHQWEKKDEWKPNNIFENDFKKICTLPIMLPICSHPISGEYILYILQKDNLRFYRYYESDSSKYMRFYSSYMKDFERYLSISLERLFAPSGYTANEWIAALRHDKNLSKRYASSKEYYQMKRTGTIGEELFLECDYVSYEIGVKKGKFNFLSMLEDSKTHDILPYVNPVVHGKLEVHPKHIERFIFKTLVLQKIPSAKRMEIDYALSKSIFIIAKIFMFIAVPQKYVECLVIAKRTAPTVKPRSKI